MFGTNRVFSECNPKTGFTAWFFSAREGTFGPYPNRKIVVDALDAFVDKCIKQKDDGGRSKGITGFSLKPIADATAHDPFKRMSDAWEENRGRNFFK